MPGQTISPTVLGVYLGHDLGACLLRGGRIAYMLEEERLNRFKHGRPNSVAGLWNRFAGKFGYFPWASVCYCIEAAGVALDEVDLIAVGDELWASAAAETVGTVVPIRERDKVVFMREPKGAAHHYHHALSAFLSSPFEEAAVLVVDGDGNSDENGYEAETGFHFLNRQGEHRVVFKNRYTDRSVPRSGVGWTYEQVTLLLGFANREVFIADAGKTMGLSAYGRPRPEFEEPWFGFDGFKIDFSAFQRWLKESGYASHVLAYGGGLATRPEGVPQYAKDLACKVQAELEAAMLHLAGELHRSTGSSNLCLAGGVALNSVSNGVLAGRGPFPNIFIQPAAHDGGQALGLAYRAHLMLASGERPGRKPAAPVPSPPISPMEHAFGGRTYSPEEIRDLLDASGLPFEELPDDDSLCEDAAGELAEGRIVGWFQGGSEFGPRALGHRSILAHPGPEGMKDQLNSRVKFRESFRPFAPAVLLEAAGRVFEMEGPSPYMLLVVPVRESWRARVPAVTHADGTARVQTVNPRVQPLFHRLISAFEKRSGIPLVVNTSFNLRGMPIVESPFDALQCFAFTDMDLLYLGRFKVRRAGARHLFPSPNPAWQVVGERETRTGRLVLKARDARGAERAYADVGPVLLRMLEEFDGGTSVLDAYTKASRGADAARPAEELEEALDLVKRLVRHGALGLRAGSLQLGLRDEGLHWWQAPVQ